MKLKDLKANPRNPRKITDKKLEMLKKSLAEFGDLSGIVFNKVTGNLVGGHQRLKVLPLESEIKMDTETHGHVMINGDRFNYRVVEWDENKEKAANIAANKHGGEFDLTGLSEWLLELDAANIDMDLTGFDADELKELMAPVHKLDAQCDEDEIPEKVEPRTKRGDIYKLGNHRLMCGDSTMIDEVERLMDGKRAEITFTSPPYNLGNNAKLRGYNGDGKDSAYIEKSDHKTEEECLQFLLGFTNNCLTVSDEVFVNIQILAGNKTVIPKYWNTLNENLRDIIIWDKEHAQPAAALRVLNSVWEFIFIFSSETNPTRAMKYGDDFRGTVDNIFRLNPVGKKDALAKDHGAVFPVQYAEWVVGKFSNESVLDVFGGSGTTMIAAEKLGRRSYLMELDPHYCDVIVARWENYTGKKAELLSAGMQQ